MKPKIPYTRPSITELEIRYASDAAANGWGERCYEYIGRFESMFAEHIGSKHVIATSSCTGALHMGLAALGIGLGDEVILADTNWVATVAPVVHLGAKPVFADIDPRTWCIDASEVERLLTSRTKAIIATHIYGNLCEMNTLLAIGEKHGIPIIEDAAEAIGSTYQGNRAGSMATFGVFSFHGSKTLTTGEGGVFATDDSSLYEHVLTLSNHGRSSAQRKQFWPDMIGYKFKMSNIQAAIGVAQMLRIEELITKKREIFQAYHDRLGANPDITMNPELPGTTIGAWMPTVVFSSASRVTREDLVAAYSRENIDARVFFYPLSGLPMFGGRPSTRIAADIPQRAINLPSFHDMRSDEIQRVAAVVENLSHG